MHKEQRCSREAKVLQGCIVIATTFDVHELLLINTMNDLFMMCYVMKCDVMNCILTICLYYVI